MTVIFIHIIVILDIIFRIFAQMNERIHSNVDIVINLGLLMYEDWSLSVGIGFVSLVWTSVIVIIGVDNIWTSVCKIIFQRDVMIVMLPLDGFFIERKLLF